MLRNGGMEIKKSKIKRVEHTGNFNDEYVYDIGMSDQSKPWFFGNDILLHNSAYFSLEQIEGLDLTKDNFIEIANMVADKINESFPAMMLDKFAVTSEFMYHPDPIMGQVIKVARENCATTALFIKKKRYALLAYDKENKRQDINGKPGSLKIMGLETQRSDTPKFIQEFLKECLMKTLCGAQEKEVAAYVKQFRTDLRERSPWMLGSPKRCNKLTSYSEVIETSRGTMVPGHVRAAYNWNKLKLLNSDKLSTILTDGHKVVVCKLKSNSFGFKSIAYPVDQEKLPDWFKSLPFDTLEMEELLIDQKVRNILGVLKWDLHEKESALDDDELF